MSVLKRKSAKFFRVYKIHQTKIKVDPDYDNLKIYKIDGQKVVRVRLFGIITRKYEKIGDDGKKAVFMTLDDGTDTISLNVWEFKLKEGENEKNTLDMIKGIEVGDIVDVIGKIRDYNDEFFISLENIKKKDIEWEMNKRAMFLTSEINNNQGSNNNDKVDTSNYKKIVFDTIDELGKSIDDIKKETGLNYDIIKEVLNELRREALVLEPTPGTYKRVPDI